MSHRAVTGSQDPRRTHLVVNNVDLISELRRLDPDLKIGNAVLGRRLWVFARGCGGEKVGARVVQRVAQQHTNTRPGFGIPKSGARYMIPTGAATSLYGFIRSLGLRGTLGAS